MNNKKINKSFTEIYIESVINWLTVNRVPFEYTIDNDFVIINNRVFEYGHDTQKQFIAYCDSIIAKCL